jgi:hypothetical protein
MSETLAPLPPDFNLRMTAGRVVMEDHMMTRRTISAAGGLAVSIVAGLALTGHARAESFKDKSGQVVFVPTTVENGKQADGSTVLKISSIGISIANLPFPFDYMKSQCSGTTLVGSDGKPGRSRGMCEVLSSKGDRAAYTYVGDAAGGRATWVEGTGAYAGIKGGTTYTVKAAMPGGGAVYEWTGTWQTD